MIMKCLTGSDGLAKEAFTVSILYVVVMPNIAIQEINKRPLM